MNELLEYIIKNIAGEGVDFSITQTESESGVEFTIKIPEAVSGRIIGKGGRIIKAIRDIVNVIARNENKRIFIKVVN